MKLIPLFPLILASFILVGCATVHPMRQKLHDDFDRLEIGSVTSAWHFAAQWGMFDEYFDAMTDDAVFLGTDATERWTKAEFMEYAREPFADNSGWTYKPRDQHVAFSDDRQTAWVDELLDNEKYGTLRGTAVLVKQGDDWKIAHYSLTFLVPNEIAGEVVELIKTDPAGTD